MSLRTLSDLGDLSGKRVIVRCDLNVPLQDGEITDDGRIRASVPTIAQLVSQEASVVVIAHLGRPKGQPNPAYSLRPVAVRLAELLGRPVQFADDTVGPSAQEAVAALKPGQVALLENLRFQAAETSKDDAEREAFAQQLAAFGDAMVSDGFGVVHRKQASVYDLPKLLPSAAGLLIEHEVSVMERVTDHPERPYTVVLGGSKVSDKLGVIDHLLPRVDSLVIGGGMVFTFLKALGNPVGKSLLEEDQIPTVLSYLDKAKELGVTVHLPTDIVVATEFAADAPSAVVPTDGIEASELGPDVMGLDIGPASADAFAKVVLEAKTIFWNGPMGVFEFERFSQGTRTVAKALSESNGFSLIGGGDSAAAARAFGYTDQDFGHISTGGGAGLEFLEGKVLPGLEVLGWQ